jgi:hypothetical protein
MVRTLARLGVSAAAVTLAACLLPTLDALKGGVADGGLSDGGLPKDAAPETAPVDGALPTDGGFTCPALSLVPSGLVAYYPMNETSGTVVHDCSGNGLDGTLQGDGTWTAGGIGGTLTFGGASACVLLPSPTPISLDFDGKTGFTIAFFATISSTTTTWPRYFIAGKTTNPQVAGWRASVEFSATRFNLAAPNGDGGTFGVTSSPGVVNVGETHHVVMLFAPGAQSRVFLDGVQRGSLATPGPFAKDSVSMRLGCSGDNQNFFQGRLDEVRFYNQVLSMQSITELANQK